MWLFVFSLTVVASAASPKPMVRSRAASVVDAHGDIGVFPDDYAEDEAHHQATLAASEVPRKRTGGVVGSLGEFSVLADNDYAEDLAQLQATKAAQQPVSALENSDSDSLKKIDLAHANEEASDTGCACDGCLFNGVCRSVQNTPGVSSAKCAQNGGHWGGCGGCLSPSFFCRSMQQYPTANEAACNANGWLWCAATAEARTTPTSPTKAPTKVPTAAPTNVPTAAPTKVPTAAPTAASAAGPSIAADVVAHRRAKCSTFPYQRGGHRNAFYDGCKNWDETKEADLNITYGECKANSFCSTEWSGSLGDACCNGMVFMACNTDAWLQKGCNMMNPTWTEGSYWDVPKVNSPGGCESAHCPQVFAQYCTSGKCFNAVGVSCASTSDCESTGLSGYSCAANVCTSPPIPPRRRRRCRRASG